MAYYPLPLHLQGLYDDLGYAEGSLPVCEQAGHEVLSLPTYPELTEDQIQTVVEAYTDRTYAVDRSNVISSDERSKYLKISPENCDFRDFSSLRSSK